MPDVQRKLLQDVFKTVGLPPYTYVKPKYYGEIRADVVQPGKHILIEGPSGIGKTCVIYKVFEELEWEPSREYRYVSCRDEDAGEIIHRHLEAAASSTPSELPKLLVVDDFHLLEDQKRRDLGSRLKRVSDTVFERGGERKFVLIGIPSAGNSLLDNSRDLGPRIGIYPFKSASDREIAQLLHEGETALNILFEDEDILKAEAGGNFWLAQYICNKICAIQGISETQDDVRIISFDLLGIRERLMDELSAKYENEAAAFCKGVKWRPGGNKPYLEVFTALTKIPDSVVSFDKILSVVPERRKPGIKAIRTRIPEAIHDPTKDIDLRKQLFFQGHSFSIEDPLFRYYLSHLSMDSIYKKLGIEHSAATASSTYAYDVGFSFSGISRRLVELANEQLKNEDIITFYDYDQQAFLLGRDLESFLRSIYSESCRYYLIFLEETYRDRVWAQLEKDAMTRPGRRDHIIPVILDDTGASGLLGIPKSIGHIDLRSVWTEIRTTNKTTDESINIIRNRLVLPLVEKIDQ